MAAHKTGNTYRISRSPGIKFRTPHYAKPQIHKQMIWINKILGCSKHFHWNVLSGDYIVDLNYIFHRMSEQSWFKVAVSQLYIREYEPSMLENLDDEQESREQIPDQPPANERSTLQLDPKYHIPGIQNGVQDRKC